MVLVVLAVDVLVRKEVWVDLSISVVVLSISLVEARQKLALIFA